MHAFYDRVTDRARRAMEFANYWALRKKHRLVTNLHILWGILEEGHNTASKVLGDMQVDLRKLQQEVVLLLGEGDYATHDKAVCYSEEVRQCICDAISLGLEGPVVLIGCHHLILAMLVGPANPAAELLDRWGVTQELTNAHVRAIVKPVL